MQHVRERKVVAPLLFMLAAIAAAAFFVSLEEGHRNGTIIAAATAVILSIIAIFESKRPITLTDDEKRRMDLKPPHTP